MMSKLTLGFITFVAGLIIIAPTLAQAQPVDPLKRGCAQGAQDSSLCKDTDSTNPLFGDNGIITRATQLVTIAVGAASVIMIMIGGFKYITSSGDSGNVESAKNTILFAIIGLVIALFAQGIVLFVLRRI